MRSKIRNFANIAISLVFIGNLLLPPIPFFQPQLRIGDILVIIFTPYLLFLKFKKTTLIFLYSIFLVSISLSIIWGYLALEVPFSLRDLNELARLALPLPILFFSYNTQDENIFIYLKGILILGGALILILAILQFFFSHNIGNTLASFYTTETHLQFINKRPVLTGSDPNIGAAIAIFFATGNLALFLATSAFKHLFLFFTLILVIISTGSRTGVVALTVGCIAILLLQKQKESILFKIKNIFILLSIIFIIFTSAIQKDYIAVGFNLAMTGENSSVNVRLQNFKNAYILFEQSPILGWGPAKAIHETDVDGEYFLLLRRYGISGTLLGLSFMIYLITALKKGGKKVLSYYGKTPHAITITFTSYLLALMVIMLTNNFISGYQILLPTLCAAGAIHSLILFAKKE